MSWKFICYKWGECTGKPKTRRVYWACGYYITKHRNLNRFWIANYPIAWDNDPYDHITINLT